MKKDSSTSSIALNLFELKQLPIFKIETHRWIKFEDKQKFLPLFRHITYQCREIMSKMFLFHLSQQKKDKVIKRKCIILTQKQIISLQGLYQILNQKMSQADFNAQVERIKQFQKQTHKFIANKMTENYVKFKRQHYLTFNIYKEGNQYAIKANINHFNFEVQYFQNKENIQKPHRYIIKNGLVKEYLNIKLSNLLQMANSMKVNQQISQMYRNFYDKIYFQYDQYHLKLQVYENYPMLRLKNYMTIKFIDKITQQPLNGPIFANADPQCMYGHFFGYNANTTKQLQGTNCQFCMLPIQQLQEFQLMIMLRDNVLNPEGKDMLYCPQYNRFKLFSKVIIPPQNQQAVQENRPEKNIIDYLNYYHLKINLKKMTNKIRNLFLPKQSLQTFPLTFKLYNRQFLIIDPARGKYCQHFAFTDLRLYYLSFNHQNNLYTCPICKQQFLQNQLLYLRQVQIIIEYTNFKLEQCPELFNTAKVVVDSQAKKVYVEYHVKDGQKPINEPLQKKDELIDYYKTLQNPFIPFMQYGLGMRQKQRQQKMNNYMFGGWKQQMQEQMHYVQQQDEQQDN